MLTASLPLIKAPARTSSSCTCFPCYGFLVAHFDIYVTASHLPDLITITADHLTLGNMAQAFTVTPTVAVTPTPPWPCG